jgi:TfoX/Sxy family transcriptional regulator of competence genes
MIVTVAYDEDLANRIRELIASEDRYTEQKMFGGIGFMIDGHMALGVSGEGGLMIHGSKKEEVEALLAKPGARPFEMRGREVKGWLRVGAESVSTKRALEPWVMQSVAFARALPPKEKK